MQIMSLANEDLIIRPDAERLLLGIDHALESSHAKIRGAEWRGSKATAKDALVTYRPWEWLYCGLLAFADLLEIAPEWLPVKDFIEELLKDISTSEKGKFRLRDARARLRGANWTNLLNFDCEAIALLLRQLVEWMKNQSEEWTRMAEKSRKAEDRIRRDKKRKRRPIPFRHDGRDYRFGYRQALLLNCLRDGEQRSIVKVIDRVWGKEFEDLELRILENRLHQLQLATKRALKANGLPYDIIRPEPNFIQLRQLRIT
jgi:hypothetical protein